MKFYFVISIRFVYGKTPKLAHRLRGANELVNAMLGMRAAQYQGALLKAENPDMTAKPHDQALRNAARIMRRAGVFLGCFSRLLTHKKYSVPSVRNESLRCLSSRWQVFNVKYGR